MRKLKFPEKFIEIEFNKRLSSSEIEKIKEGIQPVHMDNKWIVYFEDNYVFFLKFLTGNCIWKAHI